jgi:hypothetical protein
VKSSYTDRKGAEMPEGVEILENTEQKLTDDESRALAARAVREREKFALLNDIELAGDLNEQLGRRKRELCQAAISDRAVDVPRLLDGTMEIKDRYHTDVADALARALDVRKDRYSDRFADWNLHLPPPEPPEFWWARTTPFDTAGHTGAWRSDGLHWWGGPKLGKWNSERHENFGALATFTITPDRFPAAAPPSGWWTSRPWVELFGGVEVFAPDWDLGEGHGIASCYLHLRHTLFQLGFGQDGPTPVVLGESISEDSWFISCEDNGYAQHKAMPGLAFLPEVRFPHGRHTPGDTLWAEVEVRFDIHLKSAGALVWCDPEVVIRNFQWPLAPVV